MKKLKEALSNKDYSNFTELTAPSFDNYYDTLSSILYDGYTIDYDHHEAVENSGRIEKYAIREWLCTDTHVGLYLYLIDGEQICLSYQQGRKCEPEWEFFSVESKMKLRQLFDEYMPVRIEPDDTPLVNKDLMNLLIHKDLFDYEVTNEQMGISDIINYKSYIDLVKKNLDKPHVLNSIDEFEKTLKEHEDFMQMLLDNDEHESHTRNLIETQPIYEEMKKLVETLKETKS